jgi:arginyl-tRNA synthetase
MNIELILKENVVKAIATLYNTHVTADSVQINATPKNFEGNYSVVVFPYLKLSGKGPEDTGREIGAYLKEQCAEVVDFNVVKGFCNLHISDVFWRNYLKAVLDNPNFGQAAPNGQTVVVEYSSPNTNKPLHLGHIRNNLLGYAAAEILKAAGYNVKKVQIINDRGIHICKSMLAWQKWGEGKTPESSGIKGDHLVGNYYVMFETKFQEEYKGWQKTEAAATVLNEWLSKDKEVGKAKKELEKKQKEDSGFIIDDAAIAAYFFKENYKNTFFNSGSTLGAEAREMLQQWEAGDAETVSLWKTMNSWVYVGFEETYKSLGVDFDKLYYESETYLSGKQLVEDNLHAANPVFFKKEDGSVWIDLKDVKLDEKVVLRSDGTSMYITQDMGTAQLRYQDFNMDRMIYVVGNEQEYHFKVLFEILHRLGHPYAKKCYHLSYGMVELPEGKMKSREGTVVDADDLVDELISDVKAASEERATLEGLADTNKLNIWRKVALGALKFYILKVEPKKGMVFDPKQSIDLQGHTGPYIQNAYVRTQSVQRAFAQKKVKTDGVDYSAYPLHDIERELLLQLQQFPATVLKAAEDYNPGDIANYLYELGKCFHQFWNIVKILDENDLPASAFRLDLSKAVAKVLSAAGGLLGMEMPERM